MDKTDRMFNVHQQTQDILIQPVTDWTECIICQKATTEVLRCPAESKRGTQGAGYQNHADLLQGFHKARELPKSLDLSRLDDGGGIEATLNEHKAKWHELCRLLHNRTMLQRVEKRKLLPSEYDDSNSCSSSKLLVEVWNVAELQFKHAISVVKHVIFSSNYFCRFEPILLIILSKCPRKLMKLQHF